MSLNSFMPADLLMAIEFAYTPSGLICQHLLKEAESREYGACVFEIHHRRIKFRVAKITPTKLGQFVTLWKRMEDGVIGPHDLVDPIDFFVVGVRNAQHMGQFVFPKEVLFEKGIVSQAGRGGKRAMRIYPPWDITDSRQAKKTQAWQLPYFFEIHPHQNIPKTSIQAVRKLFHCGP